MKVIQTMVPVVEMEVVGAANQVVADIVDPNLKNVDLMVDMDGEVVEVDI